MFRAAWSFSQVAILLISIISLPGVLVGESCERARQEVFEIENDSSLELSSVISGYRSAIKLCPGLAEAYHNLAIELFNAGDRNEALVVIKEGLKVDRRADFLITKGSFEFSVGELELARKDYSDALSLEKRNVSGILGLSITLDKLGKDKEAIAVIEDAVLDGVRSPDLFFSLGFLFEKDEQVERAEVYYKRALEIDSEHLDATEGLGRLYFERGSYTRCVQVLSRLNQTSPRSGRISLPLARCYEEIGQVAQARKVTLNLLGDSEELNQEYFYAYLRMLGRNRMAREGLEFIEENSEKVAKNAVFYAVRGWLYLLERELGEAESDLRSAIEADSELAEAYHNLGAVLLFKGEREEASKSLATALKLDPTLWKAQRELLKIK